MNVLEGLKSNYQGKVLARAIRAVKQQKNEERDWHAIDIAFTWRPTEEGHYYWWAVCYNKPNPDQYLPDGYIDVEEESFGKLMTKDAMERVSSKVMDPKAVRDGLVNKSEESQKDIYPNAEAHIRSLIHKCNQMQDFSISTETILAIFDIHKTEEVSPTIQNDASGPLPCHHNYIQKDTWWKSCTHCGMIAPLGQ